MRRVLKPIVCLPLLLLGHFFVQRAESQPLRMGYSGLGIGADDLSRVMEKEKVWQKHGLDVKAIYFALALPHRKVVVLDGDGNLLFNLASLADLAVQNPGNLIDVVFDNECYQSCDSFPSVPAKDVDLESIAKGCGIKNTVTVRELNHFSATADQALAHNELFFIIAKVAPGEELVPLPRQEGRENKYNFVRHIERTENIQIIRPYARRRKKDFLPPL